MFEHEPKLQLAFGAAVVVTIAIFAFASGGRERPAPPPSDAMDGVYANAACPSFQIRDGRLSFEGGELSGRVERGNSGYYLETVGALRFETNSDGCRLVTDDTGAVMRAERKEFASPVIMIQLFSSDLKTGMYWTRTGPAQTNAAAENGDEQ